MIDVRHIVIVKRDRNAKTVVIGRQQRTDGDDGGELLECIQVRTQRGG